MRCACSWNVYYSVYVCCVVLHQEAGLFGLDFFVLNSVSLVFFRVQFSYFGRWPLWTNAPKREGHIHGVRIYLDGKLRSLLFFFLAVLLAEAAGVLSVLEGL